MRLLLRHPDFRLLYAGRVLSMVGDRALWVALGIWAYDLTGSTGVAGAIFLALWAPALLAPLAGALADRLPRRRLLIVTDLATAVAVLSLVAVQDEGDVWMLHVVALLYGVSQQIDSAAKSALVHGMVPDEALAQANGLLEAARSGVRIAGPLAGAAVYAFAGGHAVAALDALTFVLAALALSRVSAPDPRPTPQGRPSRRELSAGLRHFVGSPALRPLLPLTFAAGVAVGLSEVTPLAVVTQGLDRDATFLGVLGMFGGAGAIAGGLLAARLVARVGEIAAMRLGMGAVGAALLLQATATVPTAIVATLILGAGLSAAIVALVTRLQRNTPDELQGRAFSAIELLWALPYTAAMAAGSLAIDAVGFLPLCLAGGGLLVLVAALPLRASAPAPTGHPTPVGDAEPATA
jgi:predicted MFS family arabinose efflux permease